MEYWKSLRTDKGAKFDKDIHIDAADIAPTVTWGTSPEDVVAITGVVPDPSEASDETKRSGPRSTPRSMRPARQSPLSKAETIESHGKAMAKP